MKYVVTGGSGFLGTHLIKSLLLGKHTVRNIDIVADVQDKRPGLEQIRLDIADVKPEHLRDTDVLVHLAAVTSVKEAMTDPVQAIRTNAMGSVAVMEAARVAGVKKMLFASTESVYGLADADHLPLHEDSPRIPTNIYAASKLAMEAAATSYHICYGFPSVILRFSSIYGPGQRSDQVISIFLRQAGNGGPITVQGGGQSRSFNWVGNVVEGILAAAERGKPGEVYNIAAREEITISRLAKDIAAAFGGNIKINIVPFRPGETGVRIPLSIEKARDQLGYTPKVTWNEGLSRTVADFRGASP